MAHLSAGELNCTLWQFLVVDFHCSTVSLEHTPSPHVDTVINIMHKSVRTLLYLCLSLLAITTLGGVVSCADLGVFGKVTRSDSGRLMAEPEGLDLTTDRRDLFQNVKPYYGAGVLYELRDNVPTLLSMSMRCVLDCELDQEVMMVVPTVLKSKLDQYRQLEQYNGPRILKCSTCSKYYSKYAKFVEHECEHNSLS